MNSFYTLSVLSILSLASSQDLDAGSYPVNATGQWSFAAPQYSSVDNPLNWTAQVALTRSDFQGDYYRASTWLDTPVGAPINGSSIIRDVCLFMQLPGIKKASIDYSKGRNGCNDVLGEECATKLAEFLTERYVGRTNENGTMDCNSVAGVGDWYQSIYDICPVVRETGGSGYQFNQLIPSDGEPGSALHGDKDEYWLALATPRNDTVVSAEEQYDEVSQYIFTYFIISGPEYENPRQDPSVDMVCVKPESVVEGSRELPNAAPGLVAVKGTLPITILLMAICGWML
ncbi:hypothetical protein ABW19_dt0200199 [Dactylella cylindrospora]|nr:hypothetical protein ABW19_dt0200199 [Dactylella cylindrospora]